MWLTKTFLVLSVILVERNRTVTILPRQLTHQEIDIRSRLGLYLRLLEEMCTGNRELEKRPVIEPYSVGQAPLFRFPLPLTLLQHAK